MKRDNMTSTTPFLAPFCPLISKLFFRTVIGPILMLAFGLVDKCLKIFVLLQKSQKIEILLHLGVPDNQILLHFSVPDNPILLRFSVPDNQILIHFGVPNNCSMNISSEPCQGH